MAIFPTDVVQRGAVATRPAAGIAGRLFLVTDSGSQRLTYDDGSAWQDLYVDPTWAPGSGGGGALHKLATVTLSVSGGSLELPTISGAYSRLVVDFVLATASGYTDLQCQFNSDGAAHYDWAYNYTGGSAGSNGQTVALIGVVDTFAAGQAVGRLELPGYAGTANPKSGLFQTAAKSGGGSVNNVIGSLYYHSATAISDVAFSPASGSLDAGSTATVYGVD